MSLFILFLRHTQHTFNMMILGVLVILSVDKTHLLDRHLTIQAARALTRAKRIKERGEHSPGRRESRREESIHQGEENQGERRAFTRAKRIEERGEHSPGRRESRRGEHSPGRRESRRGID